MNSLTSTLSAVTLASMSLSDSVAEISSLSYAVDDLNSRLSGVQIGQAGQPVTSADIVNAINDIIRHFGG